MNSHAEEVLIDGRWVASTSAETFQATNPTTGELIAARYPVSPWSEVDQALTAAYSAFQQLRSVPASQIANFLEAFAALIDENKAALVELANRETGLPSSPRLADVELPRTTNQLRMAAQSARTGNWAFPTIDTKANIRSMFQAIGPVAVFGPNNFPFAFGSVSGGDFAAAIAAGNPVIGKANSSHPGTTKRFAELALEALKATGLPLATVQLLYRTSHADGTRLVSDTRIGATGYTGSRSAGLQLKTPADAAGKPIYLELSSVNPVVFLPGALRERGEKLVDEYVTSVLMGAGQFCTNPGLVLLIDNADSRAWVKAVAEKFASSASGTLLSPAVERSLARSVEIVGKAGAKLLTGGKKIDGSRCAFANTLFEVSGSEFLKKPHEYQTEAFGNAALVVIAGSLDEAAAVLTSLEGNLTGCIYSAQGTEDDAAYARIEPLLTERVGRLLNDKMPTGVAVSPAMNHGGPFPSTGHPGFTAVGIPASVHRFGKLTSFDAVRPDRLPWLLKNKNATPDTWRYVDGNWTKEDLV